MKTNTAWLAFLLLSCVTLRAAARWQPLWDGKTLQGWHIIGKGEWNIEAGAIHGTHVKTEKEFSHLVTGRTYRTSPCG